MNKVYINGLGTDNLLAYDTDERTISDYNLGKLNFCDSRVFPYESEFISYTYTGITTDCSNLLTSSSGITNNRYYLHTNHQGSVIALTDNSGTNIQTYSYDSFGVPYIKTTTGTGINQTTTYTELKDYTGSLHENSRLYTGREYDRENSLYFLRARYYSPSTGKFISRDPIGQNDQINLYTYVGNSPMMYVDLMGKKASELIKKFDVTELIIGIFDLAMDDTDDNALSFYKNTGHGGAYDIKRFHSIMAMAKKNNGIVYFNGQAIEPSNLGNLLAGFNMENSNLPNSFVKWGFNMIEKNNALIEGYDEYDAQDIADADEYTDTVWYDAGIEIHSEYIKSDKVRKIELITEAIKNSTPEYERRSKLEVALRNSRPRNGKLN